MKAILTIVIFFFIWSYAKGQMPNWDVDATQFEHSMFVTAIVIDGNGVELGEESSQVAAFVGDQVRGVSTLSYEATVDRYFAYLLIHSNAAGESVSFKAYDAVNDLQFEIIETLSFEIDASLGNLTDPLELLSTELSGDTELISFEIEEVIDETSITGTDVTVALKEEVDVSALVASFLVSEGATVRVNLEVQVSEVSSQDFTELVEYVVTSANRLNSETYTVSLSIGPYPEITGLSDISIVEGEAFDIIELNDAQSTYDPADLVWSISHTGELTIALNEDNQVMIDVPNVDWFGIDTLSVMVTHVDYGDLSDSTGILLEITNVNDHPVFETTPDAAVFQDSLYTYEFSASDIDSESLTFDFLTIPDWLNANLTASGGILFGTPEDSGSYPVGVTVSDGGAITQQTFEIVVSDRLIDVVSDSFEVLEGTAFDTIFLSSLVEETDLSNFSFNLSGADDLTFQLAGDTLIVSTPDSDYFGVEVWDLEVRSSEDELALGKTHLTMSVINVNDNPVITSDPIETAIVDEFYLYNLTASDIDGDPLILIIENLPSWMKLSESDNLWILSGTPTAVGTYPVSMTISDGTQSTNQAFSITTSESTGGAGDLAPIKVVAISDQRIDEGRTFSPLDLSDFLINRDSASVSWSVVRTSDEFAVNLTGSLLQVRPPNEDWYGFEALTLVASDTSSSVTRAEQIVIFEVKNINDPPIISSSSSLELSIGEYYEYEVLVADIDGDALDFSSSMFPDWLRLITTNDGAILFGDHVDDGESQFTVSLAVTDGVVIIRQEFVVQVLQQPLNTPVDPIPLMVFPNPASNFLQVKSVQNFQKLRMLDFEGKIRGEWILNHKEVSIDIRGVESGYYLLQFLGEKRVLNRKFFKE